MGFLIRNVQPKDYRDLRELSGELNTVNLPSRPHELKKMIARSQASFSGKNIKKKDRAQFLFVVEDLAKGKVVGTSKVYARHGTPQRPHLYFEVREEPVHSPTLGVRFSRKYYRLKKDPRGYSEIGGLVLHPKYRGHGEKLGKQLSLIRFVYMRAHPTWFLRRVIAELLPPFRKGGISSLYEFYGHSLTRLPYRQADLLSFKNKKFILRLFPHADLYHDILPQEVQEDIGQTGPGSEVARKLLCRIGFRDARQVDPLDGGPYYWAPLGEVSVYRQTQGHSYGGEKEMKRGRKYLALVEQNGGIRAGIVTGRVVQGKVFLTPEDHEFLIPGNGATVYTYPWR